MKTIKLVVNLVENSWFLISIFVYNVYIFPTLPKDFTRFSYINLKYSLFTLCQQRDKTKETRIVIVV